VISLTILTLVAVFGFFWFIVPGVNLVQSLVGLLIVGVISFLFATVAARAIAIVGMNPVSGMTLMTLIISSIILKLVGVGGETGLVAALLIGGVVCTALSMSGGFISDLKIGYWLGTTPAVQQKWKFLATVVSAVCVTAIIMVLNTTYGFSGPGALPAPQANAMVAVIEPLMTGQPAPWLLYMAGIFMALILQWTGLPALAFALGMYLPLEVNTPILAGGLVAYYVSQRRQRHGQDQAQGEGHAPGQRFRGRRRHHGRARLDHPLHRHRIDRRFRLERGARARHPCLGRAGRLGGARAPGVHRAGLLPVQERAVGGEGLSRLAVRCMSEGGPSRKGRPSFIRTQPTRQEPGLRRAPHRAGNAARCRSSRPRPARLGG
jgi:hypothetical protein